MEQINEIKETIIKNPEPFQIWLTYHCLNINRIAENTLPDEKTVETKHITHFCSDINNHLKQERFLSHVLECYQIICLLQQKQDSSFVHQSVLFFKK